MNLAEQANFELNHTFFLNLLAAAVAALLLALRHWSPKRSQAADHSP